MPLWAAHSLCLTILLINNLFLILKGSRAPCPVAVLPAGVQLLLLHPLWLGAILVPVKNDRILMPRSTTAETSCGIQGQRICLVGKHSHCWDTNIQTLSCCSGQDKTGPAHWSGLNFFVFMAHWQGSLLNTDCPGKLCASLPATSVKSF